MFGVVVGMLPERWAFEMSLGMPAFPVGVAGLKS